MDNMDEKAYVFGSIFALANRLQILGDKFDKNLTVKQWLLLVVLSKNTENAPTLSEVSKQIGNSRQNVKKMALILEREDFINLRKDPIDARILRLELTKKCIEYFKNREKKELEFLEQLYKGFDTDLIKGLYAGAVKLTDNVNKMETDYDFNEEEK